MTDLPLDAEFPRVLTSREAAKALRVSIRTFRRIVASGELRVSRLGQRVLVTLPDLRAYLDAKADGPRPPGRPLGVPVQTSRPLEEPEPRRRRVEGLP